MKHIHVLLVGACGILAFGPSRVHSQSIESTWEGYRNRLADGNLPTIRNDFGFRSTNNAGGKAGGEIGGFLRRSLTPSSYSRPISPRSLDDKLGVSGVFSVARNEIGSGLLIGWFNDASRGWRTANSLAMRIDGNRNGNWIFFEYGTQNWKSGTGSNFDGIYQTTKSKPVPADGKPHRFQLCYDPHAAGGDGEMTLTLDDRVFRSPLAPGHRREGARFNRFGVFNQQISGKGMEVYFDDLELDGIVEEFDHDPCWIADRCAATFVDRGKRPMQDFGLVAPAAAGLEEVVGGLIWRDEQPAYFARPIPELSLESSFEASGKVRFSAAASDSGAYFGWFNRTAKKSNVTRKNKSESPSQQLAILIEGPSRDGHYFRPTYRVGAGAGVCPPKGPPIYPNGQWHSWKLSYRPQQDGTGRVVAALDGTENTLAISSFDRKIGARFDAFGLLNHQTGGHYVELYLADLRLASAGVVGTKP